MTLREIDGGGRPLPGSPPSRRPSRVRGQNIAARQVAPRRAPYRLTHLVGYLALLLGLLLPQVAFAHALDVYLQATYITIAPAQIVIELDLTPGVLIAPDLLPLLDADGDQEISQAEGRAYVDAMLSHVALQVDGSPLALTVTQIDMPSYLNLQADYGTIRIFTAATLPEALTGTHQLAYTNNFAPTGSAYQVNAFVEGNASITLGKQKRDDIQQGMTMEYAIALVEADSATATTTGAAFATDATTGAAFTTDATTLAASFGGVSGDTGQVSQLLAYLYAPTLSPWVLLLALALASALGGIHALTPGHGKTLVAAYLVGTRGTVAHAVALSAIVTFTHTSLVILIGLLALFASRYIVPDVLVPVLEILSGLLVVVLGARLIRQRWIAFRRHPADEHEHEHDHGHNHDHEHGHGHTHSHLPPTDGINGGIKMGSLLAMGISGGLIPCPEALGIMVIAIGLNRILLGLGLIVSFSFGLAAVLMVIGILLVRSRSLLERFGGMSQRWSSALPLCSALIVTVLGVGIVYSGLLTYLGRG